MKNEMPVFIIKAKDKLAVQTLLYYEELCKAEGLFKQAEEVFRANIEIADWQRDHPDSVKLPDHKHMPFQGST